MVVAVGVGGDELRRSAIREPSPETSSSPIPAAGHRRAGRASSRRPGWCRLEIAVVDRDVAVGVAVRLEFRCRAEDEVAAVGREVLADEAGGGAAARVSEPFMPWTRLPSGRRTGIPVEPSAKQGEQILAPPKAKAVELGVGARPRRGKGRRRGRAVRRGCRRTLVVQPFGSAGRDVGIEAPLVGFAGARDAAVVDAVEDPRRVRSPAGSPGTASGRGPGPTRRRSRRVGGGDQLVGAAVEQQRRAGLLAGQGVGTGVAQFGVERVGRRRSGRAEVVPAELVAIDPVVIGGPRFEALEELWLAVIVELRFEPMWASRRRCRTGRDFGEQSLVPYSKL